MLDLDISICDGIFVYKLFDKRDSFPFNIVRMPHLDSNTPSFVFYSTILSEFLRIARATLRYCDFFPRVVSLVNRMMDQGGNCQRIFRQFSKAISRHPEPFKHYSIGLNEIINNIKYHLNLSGSGTWSVLLGEPWYSCCIVFKSPKQHHGKQLMIHSSYYLSYFSCCSYHLFCQLTIITIDGSFSDFFLTTV